MNTSSISSVAQTITIIISVAGFLWVLSKDRRNFRKEDQETRKENKQEDRDELMAMGGHVVATNAQLLTMIQNLESKVANLESKIDQVRGERDDARTDAAVWHEKYDNEHQRRTEIEKENAELKTQLRLTSKRSSDPASEVFPPGPPSKVDPE